MSAAGLHATTLLCRLLEQVKPDINGQALLGEEWAAAGRDLLRERVLTLTPALEWVNCPSCLVELAPVLRELGGEQILIDCDECGEVKAPRTLQQNYRVSLNSLIERIAIGLDLPKDQRKSIESEHTWRLGISEPARGRALTWYFARRLGDAGVARRLAAQIRADQAERCAKIITSCPLPLPEGSALATYSVVHLADVARLSQSHFLFFADRVSPPNAPVPQPQARGTSLIDVRQHAVAWIEGRKHSLEKMQQHLLLALLDDFDHRMDSATLHDKCHSHAERFSPRKVFDRNTEVYHTFIRFDRSEMEYELIIPEEDRSWLR